jgi:hypothetical protein
MVKPGSPLSDLRTRCTVISRGAGAAFAVLFAVTVLWPKALSAVVALGLEFALVVAGGLCTVIVVISRLLTQFAHDRQADELTWAVQLGKDLADPDRSR